jgi:hypothetical protein
MKNRAEIIKWIARILITHNFIFAIIVRTNISEYYIEGFPLILLAIWLTWYNKYFLSILLMLICFITFYIHW